MTVVATGLLEIYRSRDLVKLGEVRSFEHTMAEERPYFAYRFQQGNRGMPVVVDDERFSSVDEAIAYLEQNPLYPTAEDDVIPCGGTGVRRIAELPDGFVLALPISGRNTPGPYVSGCNQTPLICKDGILVARIRKNAKSFSIQGGNNGKSRGTLKEAVQSLILACMPKETSGHERVAWHDAARRTADELFDGGPLSSLAEEKS